MSKKSFKEISFYADYDEETGLYCVFDDEYGKAWKSFSTMEEAERNAEQMNNR